VGHPDEITELAQFLRELGAAVDRWTSHVNDLDGCPWDVQPGSSLAREDDMLRPYFLSTRAWLSATVAVDFMACLYASLTNGRAATEDALMFRYGQAALVRGGLENAATAVWLLGTPGRTRRAVNRLKLAWKEIEPAFRLYDFVGATPRRSADDLKARISSVLPQVGWLPRADKPDWSVEKQTRVALDWSGYGAIVQGADEIVGFHGTASAAWSACSGLSHGEEASTLAMLARHDMGGASSDVTLASFSMNAVVLRRLANVAAIMLHHGFALYERRRHAALSCDNRSPTSR